MKSKIVLIVISAACAGASGCSNKAAAQTPPAPARMLTADTDVNQVGAGALTAPGIGGNVGPGPMTYQKVLDGPFVVTDWLFERTSGSLYALPSGQDCTINDPTLDLDGTNGRALPAVPGESRLVIKMGEELCVSWQTNIYRTGFSWDGWKPY